MRKILHKCLLWLSAFGVDPLKAIDAFKNLPITLREYRTLKRQNEKLVEKWKISLNSPYFHDRRESSGVASGHYFHQDLLVARRIYQRNPRKHVDVGSRVDGFVAHVSVFREIEVFDIRAIPNNAENIRFVQKDLMILEDDLVNYCDSLSCLHALEHFGLGRYSDPVDVQGYEKGFDALTRMLKRDAILYLSVPIGAERVEFNGQRVFSIQRLYELFQSDFELIDFSYVDDRGDLHESAKLNDADVADNLGLSCGCGIFELRKR